MGRTGEYAEQTLERVEHGEASCPATPRLTRRPTSRPALHPRPAVGRGGGTSFLNTGPSPVRPRRAMRASAAARIAPVRAAERPEPARSWAPGIVAAMAVSGGFTADTDWFWASTGDTSSRCRALSVRVCRPGNSQPFGWAALRVHAPSPKGDKTAIAVSPEARMRPPLFSSPTTRPSAGRLVFDCASGCDLLAWRGFAGAIVLLRSSPGS